jgi:hypothetical protein
MSNGTDWGAPPTGTGDTGGGTALVLNTRLQDQAGNPWQVVRLPYGSFGLRSLSGIKSPVGGADWSLYGVIKNVSPYFLTQTGRAIQLSPDGTFSDMSLEESGNLFPVATGGGGGGSAPAFSSTREAQVLVAQQEEEQAQRDFARQKELDAIRAENEKLLQARTDLRGIAETAAAIRERERTGLRDLWTETENILGETLGKDVVRGAIRGQGGITRGETPMAGYRTGVRQVGAEAQSRLAELGPLAQPNLNADLAGTEAQIERYRGLAQPRELPSLAAPGPFTGMAEGGSMGPGMMMVGNQKRAIMLGEGEINGDEEIGIFDPEVGGITEIIPLAGGAAGGAKVGSYDYDPSTVQQAFAPVWEHLGFTTPPSYRETPTNRNWSQGRGLIPRGFAGVGGNLSGIQRLGVQPRLIRAAGTGQLYYRDELGLRPISSRNFERFGFSMEDVVNLNPAEIRSLGRVRGALTTAPPVIESGVSERRFPPSAEPIYLREGPSGLRGMAIPTPRTFASLARNLSASTRAVIASALGLVNYSPEDIEEEMQFFTPGGTATRPRAALLA